MSGMFFSGDGVYVARVNYTDTLSAKLRLLNWCVGLLYFESWNS